jgi:hypothetical protein
VLFSFFASVVLFYFLSLLLFAFAYIYSCGFGGIPPSQSCVEGHIMLKEYSVVGRSCICSIVYFSMLDSVDPTGSCGKIGLSGLYD